MVIDRLPNYALTSEFGNIELSSVSGYVDMEIIYQNTQILNERYIPNQHGFVTIFDIGNLAYNLADIPGIYNVKSSLQFTHVSFTIKLTEKNSTAVENIVYFYISNANTNGTVDKDNIFITPLSLANEKRTGVGRKEFISFMGVEQSIACYAVYKSTTGDKAKTILNYANPTMGYTGITSYDVSPAAVALKTGCLETDLIYYNIYKDQSRVIKYVISDRQYPHLKTFAFINNFYAQETFHTLEAGNSQIKFDRNIGSVKGVKRQFKPVVENTFTVDTGWLRRSELPVLEDLLTSQRVGILENTVFVPIIILTDTVKLSDKRDELISVEFSYKYADDRYKRHNYVARAFLGVFDSSFDNTFN